MSNQDLINRSELKKAIETYDTFACLPNGKLYPVRDLLHPENYYTYIHVKDVVKAIDNAPTVEGRMFYVQETVNTILNSCTGNTDIDKAFRNAARLVQNAIDGKSVDFEEIERGEEE